MNRIRLLAIGTMLMFALTTVAQQTTTQPGGPAKGVSGDAHDGGVPTVEGHLKLLTEKLDLTGDQQTKIKPILQELHDATQKLMQDEGMSREERLGNVSACPYKADKEIREILNDENRSLNLQLWLGHLLIAVTYRPRSLSVYFPRLGQGEGADQNLTKDALLPASAPAVPSSTSTWRPPCSG